MEFVEVRPQGLKRAISISIKCAPPDSFEGPSCPLELLLTTPVLVPTVGAMPRIPVTLDGESAIGSLDHDVDSVPADFPLRADPSVALIEDAPQNITLELALAALFNIGVRGLCASGVLAMTNEFRTWVAGREVDCFD